MNVIDHVNKETDLIVCLFDLWFYVPGNNYGHVETLS